MLIRLLCLDVSVCILAICSLPEDYGECKEQVAMYRYDSNTAKCVRFMYSGCGGNANRFETRAMCEVACQRYMASSLKETQLQIEMSTAVPSINKGKNRKTSTCHWSDSRNLVLNLHVLFGFYWSTDQSTVTLTSTDVCEQPLSVGDCDGEEFNYYYDEKRGICREFIYTGCGGNGNRFASISDCRAQCMAGAGTG